jgi:hypothetical protein
MRREGLLSIRSGLKGKKHKLGAIATDINQNCDFAGNETISSPLNLNNINSLPAWNSRDCKIFLAWLESPVSIKEQDKTEHPQT